jgi:hypothetical protein
VNGLALPPARLRWSNREESESNRLFFRENNTYRPRPYDRKRQGHIKRQQGVFAIHPKRAMTSTGDRRPFEEVQVDYTDFLESTLSSETSTSKPNNDAPPPAAKRKVKSVKGRHGDNRMHRAVAARLLKPDLSLLQALIEGGFVFPDINETDCKSDRNVYDSDGVLLCQRKNQLSRRLRLAKKRNLAARTESSHVYIPTSGDQADSRTLQNMLLNGQFPGQQGIPIPMQAQRFVKNPSVPAMNSASSMNIMSNIPFATSFMQTAPSGNANLSSTGGDDDKKQSADVNFERYFDLSLAARQMGVHPDMRFHQMMPQFPGFYNIPGQFSAQGDLQNLNMQSLSQHMALNQDLRALLNRGMMLDQFQGLDSSQVNVNFGPDASSQVPSNFDPPLCDSPLPQSVVKTEDDFLPGVEEGV